MPRTIYELRQAGVEYPQQRPGVPEQYVYIGATVMAKQSAGAPFEWIPVWNRTGNTWTLLNRLDNGVDWSVQNITWNSAEGVIDDWDSPDYLGYTFTISQLTGPGGTVVGGTTRTWALADDTQRFPITGLKPSTWYTANLKAEYWEESGGGYTDDSNQEFQTLANPTPTAPVLSYTSATNTDINLVWTDTAGSTATTYRVYAGVGAGGSWVVGDASQGAMPTPNKYWTCIRLAADTPYYYQVAGINASGMEGPMSNRVQVHTGHAAILNEGAISEYMAPMEVGSYRPDIAWKLWYSRAANNISIYQGYWQGDPRTTGPTPVVITSQESGRYWGCIRMSIGAFRDMLNAKYGGGVWQALTPTKASFVRVYRMRTPGNVEPQYMTWNLGQTDPFTGGRPTVLASFRNAGKNDADHVAAHDTLGAGSYHDWLRLPRSWAKALINASYNGGAVNSIILNRMDHINTGYGTAGYGEWAGHLQQDRNAAVRKAGFHSDWRILISGTFSVQTRAYKGPYPW